LRVNQKLLIKSGTNFPSKSQMINKNQASRITNNTLITQITDLNVVQLVRAPIQVKNFAKKKYAHIERNLRKR